ncbi:MAG: 5'-nucleotidase [Salinimicrobium sp.]
MQKKFFILFLSSFLLFSCKNTSRLNLSKVEGEEISISDSIAGNDSIEAFIEPYKKHIDEQMNAVLAYSAYDLQKTEGELNTALGNMMADAVMEMSNPVFKKRTGNSIDIVLLNYGGIRSSVNKGDVTTRTAYQLMPFENEVIVAKLSGEQVRQMVHYLIDAGVAHPVSGIELEIGADNSLQQVLIQGAALDDTKDYFVATNDYLFQGGDNMTFFAGAKETTSLDYKIRNLLIDYFTAKDTLAPVRDTRFTRKQ